MGENECVVKSKAKSNLMLSARKVLQYKTDSDMNLGHFPISFMSAATTSKLIESY